ncbi:hypothetical protein BRYFOR_05840 [Marvinbryantia formatexigens DSM 14469]|uniref:Uncharacterized protein n=1 Tax=Marvinbryantia formatexigens DSM 14469 TaxID=478749 RepID=C6LB45_9FIRM|nr:hypothetical protein BRYFOR_05840 [Marvinbryantia formatexigens DSM 14469]
MCDAGILCYTDNRSDRLPCKRLFVSKMYRKSRDGMAIRRRLFS